MNSNKQNSLSGAARLGGSLTGTAQPVLQRYLIKWMVYVTLALGTGTPVDSQEGAIGTLGIQSMNDKNIVAALPFGIPDGDYFLKVKNFIDNDIFTRDYDLKTGPKGLQGDKTGPVFAGATEPVEVIGSIESTKPTEPDDRAQLFNQSCQLGLFVQGINSSGTSLCSTSLPINLPSENKCTLKLESHGNNKVTAISCSPRKV